MFEKFTERARQVVVLAQEEARTLKHNYIGTEHILLGLLREEEGLAARVLESLDITVERVRAQVVQIVGAGEEVTSGQIPFTPRAKKVLELALREALMLGHNFIGTEHVLLGLARENEGVAARILLDLGADSEKIRNEVIRMLGDPVARAQAQAEARSIAIGQTSQRRGIDQAWLDGLGAVLDHLAAEIYQKLSREPDTGDLLLALAYAPNTLAAQALRELGVDLDGLRGAIERLRAEALPADKQLGQQLQEVTRAKEQAIENAARLRDQERELRQQARARTAVKPEVLQEIRTQLGIPAAPSDDPPQPPEPS
jgi:ATP-dependent Clp protease ATP-binding subunit ClpA